ncbi:MAG: 2-oxoacid:acceptor oxidoreductase family protein, partial [Candidatus Omnitrophica bacterium]|nr:2-oxoacid:acceptor oxidoreductase family protein [Candidatus Omnitrophota bacterium]
EGTLIVNSREDPSVIKENLGFKGKVFTLDASKISRETIGREMPNTPMMGALIKVTKFLNLKEVLEKTRTKLQEKFRHKPEVIEGNIRAIERAYQEVK